MAPREEFVCFLMLHTNVTILHLIATNLRLSCVHKSSSSAPGKLPGFKAERRIPSSNIRRSQRWNRFRSFRPNTLGIELELQLIDPTSYDLTAASDELLAQMANHHRRPRQTGNHAVHDRTEFLGA